MEEMFIRYACIAVGVVIGLGLGAVLSKSRGDDERPRDQPPKDFVP